MIKIKRRKIVASKYLRQQAQHLNRCSRDSAPEPSFKMSMPPVKKQEDRHTKQSKASRLTSTVAKA